MERNPPTRDQAPEPSAAGTQRAVRRSVAAANAAAYPAQAWLAREHLALASAYAQRTRGPARAR